MEEKAFSREFSIAKYKVKIHGTRPLLMVRFPSEKWKLGSPPPTGGTLRTQEDYERAFQESKYLTTDGKLYCPSSQIHGTMKIAAYRVPISANGSYHNLVNSAIFIQPDEIIHLSQECVMDVRNAVNHNTIPPSAVIVCRARLDEWSLEFEMDCIDKRGKENKLKEILEIAGMFYGIGGYRPKFGRFEIVKWKKID